VKIRIALVGLLAACTLLSCRKKTLTEEIDALIEQGSYTKAESILLERDAQGDTSAVLSVLLGRVYTGKRKYEKALKMFLDAKDRVLDEDERAMLAEGFLTLAESVRKVGFSGLAVQSYEGALSVDSTLNLGKAFRFLGNRHYEAGNLESALIYYERFLEADGDLNVIFDKYLRAVYQAGDYARAVEIGKKARRAEDGDLRWIYGESLFELARMQHDSGSVDSAKAYLSQFVRFGTPRVLLDDAHFLLGQIYELETETLRAIAAYREVIDLSPRNAPLAREAELRVKRLTR
jgi:tetratricopeptide (TPR) repeat protein